MADWDIGGCAGDSSIGKRLMTFHVIYWYQGEKFDKTIEAINSMSVRAVLNHNFGHDHVKIIQAERVK